MKYLIILVVAGLWSSFMYTTGYSSASLHYTVEALASEKKLKEEFALKLEAEKKAQDELFQSIQKYQQSNTTLRNNANALRMQLDKLSNAAHKQKFAEGANCRWSAKMDAVLRRATDFAEERDAIALQYNELREQCNLN